MRTDAEVKDVENGKALPLVEAFYTIQGEGAYQGQAAYFIRLGGCDVGCVWCDVKESWEEADHPLKPVDEIVKEAAGHPSNIAVITGGEPGMYNLSYLCKKLHEAGFYIHIETSGAHPLRGEIDWICLSPKKFKAPVSNICETAQELKVIVFNKNDFKWAEEYAAKVAADCKLFLQPEWGRAEKMTPLIIDYVKAHPEWEISLQIHKYMHIP